MKIAKKFLPPIALLLVSTIGAAYGATTLFTQTFPAISATAPVQSNCPSATLVANVSSVVATSSGALLFFCPTGVGAPALVVAPGATSVTSVTVTPTFTLPAGYTALFVSSELLAGFSPPLGAPLCTGINIIPITSGTAISLTGPDTLVYCATFSNAPVGGLATFDVTWSA